MCDTKFDRNQIYLKYRKTTVLHITIPYMEKALYVLQRLLVPNSQQDFHFHQKNKNQS